MGPMAAVRTATGAAATARERGHVRDTERGVEPDVQQAGGQRPGGPVPAERSDLRDSPGSVGRWPAPGTIRGAWTAADLETLPDDGLRYEIIDGTLIVSPSPAPRHQRVSQALNVILLGACARGLQVLTAPLDWHVDEGTVVQPDIFVVESPPSVDAAVSTPLLIVEIASPSTATIDRTAKFDAYARAGVEQYWIVDPGGPATDKDSETKPIVEVFDLATEDDGTTSYRLHAKATGSQVLSVTGPIPLTLTPSQLITPPGR